MKIAIVAGEPSGDILAAGLIREIRKQVKDAKFFGIGGPRMVAEGFTQLFPMDSIALMGVESVIKDLRNILNIRSSLHDTIIKECPDCFVGVDVPDFNISLEKKLRSTGIKVVHYVSPSVWAWRGYRIHKIKKAVDHMLTLFPFEKQYYDRHEIPATFIGHPSAAKAARIRPEVDTRDRRRTIALLPGSRRAEVANLLPVMLETAALVHTDYPEMRFVLPFADERLQQLHQAGVVSSGLPIEMSIGGAEQALARSQFSIIASGTATLEAMMYGSAMVVIYKMPWLSATLFNLFKHVEHFSLPNHLLEKPQIPELKQKAVTAANIYAELLAYIQNPHYIAELETQFSQVAERLHRPTDALAAEAVLKELGRN